jgi:YtoQ family protein
MQYTIYLSGEIHSAWRGEIIEGCKKLNLDIKFLSALDDHEASDAAGDVLGTEEKQFWRDHKSAKINVLRTKTMIAKSDIVIIRFGEKYKQWNVAFDAGICTALNKPYITLHDENIIHPLKEVDAASLAWATNTEQIVKILEYTLRDS